MWSCCQLCRLRSAAGWEEDCSKNTKKSKVTPKQSAHYKRKHRVWFSTLAVLLIASGSSSSQAARVTWVIDSTGFVKVSSTWLSWIHKSREQMFNLDPDGSQSGLRWKAGLAKHVGSKLRVKDIRSDQKSRRRKRFHFFSAGLSLAWGKKHWKKEQ